MVISGIKVFGLHTHALTYSQSHVWRQARCLKMSPVSANRLLYSLSNKLRLFFRHSISPCSIKIKDTFSIFEFRKNLKIQTPPSFQNSLHLNCGSFILILSSSMLSKIVLFHILLNVVLLYSILLCSVGIAMFRQILLS